MGTFSGVMTGGRSGQLGRIGRRGGYVTLKYTSRPNTRYNNNCYPNVRTVTDRLSQDIYATNMSLRDPSQAADRPELLKKLRVFKLLNEEIQSDVFRYKPDPGTPVCFAEDIAVEIHEEVHAAFESMMPSVNKYGDKLTRAELFSRNNVVNKAITDFFANLGPNAVKLDRYLSARLSRTASPEEVITGLAGIAAVVLRGQKGRNIVEWRNIMLTYFSSYVDPSQLDAQFVPLVLNAADEWIAKYGSSLTKAIRDLESFVLAAAQSMGYSAKARATRKS